MIRTRVGYAGGTKRDPDYRHMGDHTESVQIDFDPRRITYTELLHIFWKSHRPTGHPGRGQYMKAVFYHDGGQQQSARASKAWLEKEIGKPVHTRILPVRSFYRAEDYHQKYLLKRHQGIYAELLEYYPQKKDFADSTAVARINGYIGGYGTREALMQEVDYFGLTPESANVLIERVGETTRP